jgi:hypothetical protein
MPFLYAATDWGRRKCGNGLGFRPESFALPNELPTCAGMESNHVPKDNRFPVASTTDKVAHVNERVKPLVEEFCRLVDSNHRSAIAHAIYSRGPLPLGSSRRGGWCRSRTLRLRAPAVFEAARRPPGWHHPRWYGGWGSNPRSELPKSPAIPLRYLRSWRRAGDSNPDCRVGIGTLARCCVTIPPTLLAQRQHAERHGGRRPTNYTVEVIGNGSRRASYRVRRPASRNVERATGIEPVT